MTEFGYPMYAEGLERAVKMVSKLNIPIEITENGVADSKVEANSFEETSLGPIRIIV